MADLTIIYDGECPFCSAFVRMVRLQQRVGSVALIDARSGNPLVTKAQENGCDLNRGMVVIWQTRLFHGAEAMHLLTVLTEGGVAGALQRLLFGTPARAARVYPLLAAGRRALLFVLGRRPIRLDRG